MDIDLAGPIKKEVSTAHALDLIWATSGYCFMDTNQKCATNV